MFTGAGSVTIPRAAALMAALVAASACLGQPAPATPTPKDQDHGAVAYAVVGDAIPEPLSAAPGDAARGRAIVVDRRVGLCLLCHSGPFPEERFQGNLAPSLAGAGNRWRADQLRLRIVDPRRLNPATLMPSYHRTDGLNQVGTAFQDKPLLDARQIEDVVAFLRTLRE